MKRRLLRLAVVVLIVAAGIWAWQAGWFNRAAPPSTISGNVEVREVDLGFRVGGRIAQILVDEGDIVVPGAELARLDPAPFADALASARADTEIAAMGLDRQRNGSRPQEINEAEAALRAAQAVAANADKEFARASELASRGFVSAARVDAARAARDTAQAKIEEQRARVGVLREGTRSDVIAESAASRDAAIVRQRKASTDIGDTHLFAPSAGVVQTRIQEPGAIVAAGAPVLVLAITQPVRVRAYVPEPMLAAIKPGQLVWVKSDGGQRLRGRIGHVSPTAEFTPRTVETESQRVDLVYRIRVIVADPQGQLRQGQPVTVDLGSEK